MYLGQGGFSRGLQSLLFSAIISSREYCFYCHSEWFKIETGNLFVFGRTVIMSRGKHRVSVRQIWRKLEPDGRYS